MMVESKPWDWNSLYLKSVEYLKSNPMKHLSTLKYLFLYKDKVAIDLIEDSSNWALVVKIPTKFLSKIIYWKSCQMTDMF